LYSSTRIALHVDSVVRRTKEKVGSFWIHVVKRAFVRHERSSLTFVILNPILYTDINVTDFTPRSLFIHV